MKIENAAAEVRHHVDLAALKRAAEAAHEEVAQSGEEVVRKQKKAGDVLLAIKKAVGQGHFKAWCHDNLKFSYETASRYMRISRHWADIEPKMSSVTSWSQRATLKVISKRRRKRPSSAPIIPKCIAEYEEAVKNLNREFGYQGSSLVRPSAHAEARYPSRGFD